MARKKQYKAVVSDEMYMEDLIWMSYRYCIGRKTIAAHSHAGNIARYSFDHISDGRKRFMAKDIREEINDVLNVSAIEGELLSIAFLSLLSRLR